MAIQMRRGLYADLDKSKLVAGEIVMSTDSGYVGIAKAPSDVMQLATVDMLGGIIKEMTYAEYQALTPAQKNDGTVRFIADYPSGEKYLDQTIVTSTSTSVTATFTDSAITTDSVIDVYTSVYGLNHNNITVTSGQCVVTFPAQSSSQSVTVRIYIR